MNRVDRSSRRLGLRRLGIRRPAVGRAAAPTVATLAAVLAVAACTSAGTTPTVPPTGTAAPSASATPPAATGSPSPSAAPTMGPCERGDLAAKITLWEGAAGHRVAHVELANTGPRSCLLPAIVRPQLVDAKGVLIDGPAASPGASGGAGSAAPASPAASSSASAALTLAAGSTVKTLVQATNYCGAAPVAPVTLAFVLPNGDRVMATPASPTDANVPPCLGGPEMPADVTMQPWAP